MDYKADVVFFGNSITYGGHFQEAFPNQKIVNLGYPGDKVSSMLRRIEAIKSVSPKKVFIMAGINGLKKQELDEFEDEYSELVDSIQKSLPSAVIYLQSILPIAKAKEKTYGPNEKIIEANEIIKSIARLRHLTYIDLHSLYVKDGALPDSITKDGVHLKADSYKAWYDEIEQYVSANTILHNSY